MRDAGFGIQLKACEERIQDSVRSGVVVSSSS
jgi:hypothetical protein